MLTHSVSRSVAFTGRSSLAVARPLSSRRQQLIAAASSESAVAASGKVIILYTKASCPLCDGTRDRMQGLIDRAQFMPSALSEWSLELRDIATDPAWSAAYDMEVPVLTAFGTDGKEVRLPRPAPRMTTDKLRQFIEAALPQ